jgi:signal transduction histidine kinase
MLSGEREVRDDTTGAGPARLRTPVRDRSRTVSDQADQRPQRRDAVSDAMTEIARELRAPLFSISSAAQLLRLRAGEDPVVEKNAGRILREVERLTRIAAGLQEFGRLQCPVLAAGDPDDVWDRVIERHRTTLEAKRLSLHRRRADPPRLCPIDAEQLGQVFDRLLLNAAHASPQGNEVTLTTSTVPAGAWRLRLHNSGPAIPADVLPRVFDMFQSSEAAVSGLGLAVCRRIIDGHDGTISVDSSPEAGTTVTVSLKAIE